MHTAAKLVSIILISFMLFGCGGNKIKLDPVDPLFRPKNEFYTRYGFFTSEEEWRTLVSLTNPEDIKKFEDNFWKIRDIDPRTEKNEFKDQIDSRISDIENEILFRDFDVSGVSFKTNGGLRGDMAHVYLLYGMPHFKAKLPEGTYHTALMAWYYFDLRGRPIMRFLFYEEQGSGQMRLFKDQLTIISQENLFDPAFSPLRKISNRPAVTSPQEMADVWYELQRDDVAITFNGYSELVFTTAFFEFSPYSDVVIEGGGNKKIGALDVPKPAGLVAAESKPDVAGQPTDTSSRQIIYSKSNSLIPAELVIKTDPTSGKPSLAVSVAYADVDWEIKDNEAEALLDLSIRFQNEKTKLLDEFKTRIKFKGPKQAIGSLIRTIDGKTGKKYARTIDLNSLPNYASGNEGKSTLSQLIDSKLSSGEYVINVYLQHTVTKKSNSWREEIVIK